MKYLKRFNEEHVFKLKKPELLDVKVWNPISRGLRSEIIKDIKVAPNYDNITVNYADGTSTTVKLKKIIKTVSNREKDYNNPEKSRYVNRKYTRYTSDMENEELYKILIKPLNLKTKEKTSKTVTANGQTYPAKDVHDLIQELKSYKRLIELGMVNTSSNIQRNRGTVQLSKGTGPSGIKYCIYKTGKVYKGAAFQPMYAKPPFETLEDYDNALQAVLKEREERFKNELERWRIQFEKDPTALIKAPLYITKVLNPRLGNIAKTGIFEKNNEDSQNSI